MQNAHNIRHIGRGLLLAVVLLLIVALPARTALAAPAAYTVTELSPLAGYAADGTYAEDVNDSGQVVGVTYDATFDNSRAVLWQEDGTPQDLGNLPGATSSRANGINDLGQVVGGSGGQAFLWENGQMTALDDLVAADSPVSGIYSVKDINDAGQIIGSSYDTDNAALFDNGQVTELSPLPGYDYSLAFGMNEAGQVVGTSGNYSDDTSRATLWENGQPTDLGALQGSVGASAYGINATGQVAGESSDAGWNSFATLWDGNQASALDNSGYSGASAINDSGQVVGYANDGATLWENGQSIYLNDRVPAGTGYLGGADGINTEGQIIAYTSDAPVLLTPSDQSPPPNAPANDAFADAETVSGASADGSNVDATRETDEPDHRPNSGFSIGEHSVWYSWTAPANGNYQIDTCTSDFDTVLAVYEDGPLSNLNQVANDDDGCDTGSGSEVMINAQANTTYKIAVAGYGSGDTGGFTLNISESALSDVSVSATDRPDSVVLGQNVTYTLTANNNGPNAAEGVEGELDFEDAAATVVSMPADCESDTYTNFEDVVRRYVYCDSPGTLSNGGQRQWDIVLKPSRAGTLPVWAYAWSSITDDPNWDNEELQLETTVQNAPPPPPPPPADTTAPVIKVLSPKVTKDNTPTIKAKVSDDVGPQLQKTNIKLFVDGKSKSKFSYNAATDVLTYKSTRLKDGKHKVKIVATDPSGPDKTTSWTLKIK